MVWLLSAAGTAQAFVIDVTVDTSSLSGTAANLPFDFIDGDGVINNTVKIGSFITDGSFVPGDAELFGDASGSLNATVTLGDSSFFNELLQPITLGASLQFRLEATDLFDAAGVIPDSFAFYILDATVHHNRPFKRRRTVRHRSDRHGQRRFTGVYRAERRSDLDRTARQKRSRTRTLGALRWPVPCWRSAIKNATHRRFKPFSMRPIEN